MLIRLLIDNMLILINYFKMQYSGQTIGMCNTISTKGCECKVSAI